MSALSFRSLTKSYRGEPALDSLDLDVREKSFTVVCGPPKSGKSVLCRLIVGLEYPDAGTIRLGGEDITRLAPAERQIGYVPQSFALYPHLTVAENVGYALALHGASSDEIARRVDWAASLLSITHLLKKTPDQLSGGEKQRTALARGLLKNAQVFVLDDPLVGLDYKLRERLMDELKSLREEIKATFLYFTADSIEALTMAQDLVVLDAGRVAQRGDAISLYNMPQNVRTLELIGFPKANVLDATIAGGTLTAGPLRLRAMAPEGQGNAVKVGFRPEALRRGSGRGVDGEGRVMLVENLGGELVVYLESNGAALVMAYPAEGESEPEFGGSVAFTINPNDIVLFDAQSGQRLGSGPGAAA
jgi:multiple sugar transport system ATP-binding protein